jgi:hypothetical protein
MISFVITNPAAYMITNGRKKNEKTLYKGNKKKECRVAGGKN